MLSKFLAARMTTGLAATSLQAQRPQLPPGYPLGLYDESKVPQYSLTDPLVLRNGKSVRNVRTWQDKRCRGILKLFETYCYGRTLAGRLNVSPEAREPRSAEADREGQGENTVASRKLLLVKSARD
jgi:hypothetical protein